MPVNEVGQRAAYSATGKGNVQFSCSRRFLKGRLVVDTVMAVSITGPLACADTDGNEMASL